jgi:hypothetical protein
MLAAMASLLAVGTAMADAPPCKSAGSAAAKPMFYYTADDDVLDGLEVTLDLGLEPGTFPAQDIAKIKDACVHASFTASGKPWTLYGEDDETPPRWARTPGDATTFYLAAMPPADQAHLWAEAQRRHATGEKTVTFKGMMFALVATDGDNRRIFGFYDSLPDDARLTAAMQAAIEGRTPAIIGFNLKTRKMDNGRMIDPLTLLVVDSKGKTPPVDKVEPDGGAFDGAVDGAAKARLAGLTCPPAAGVLRRSALFTTGAADGSQEVGCRYVGERGRILFAASRTVPGATLKDAITRMMLTPMSNSVGDAPGPTPTLSGIEKEEAASTFFKLSDGARAGVWALKRGGWFIEIYALYGPGEESAVSEAASALLNANPRAP